MRTFFLVSGIFGLLLYSIGGLLHLNSYPHDHLLLGFVTPEQLRGHEATETQEIQDIAVAPPAPRSGSVAVTSTGGLILSVAPGLSGLILTLHLEIALQFAFLLFIPLIHYGVSIFHVLLRTVTLASPDPPPRALLASG